MAGRTDITGRSPVRTPDGVCDKHRFDSYSSWLDREERMKARAQGKALGYGFVEPAPPPPPRPGQDATFFVDEFSFTSGVPVRRHYPAKPRAIYATEATRADPFHFPNYMEVRKEDHYGDHRRRSHHVDPKFWRDDPALKEAVSDEMVKIEYKNQKLRDSGNKAYQYDPNAAQHIFISDVDVKPQNAPRHELNADMSCLTLPPSRNQVAGGGGAASSSVRTPGGQGGGGHGGGGGLGGGGGSHGLLALGALPAKEEQDARWKWCLGGRELHPHLASPPSRPGRSPSAPALPGSQALQHLQPPRPPAVEWRPFHGDKNRQFGESTWCGRMRGGKLAKEGFAGTAPVKGGPLG